MELTAKVVQILPQESGISKTSGNPWAKQSIIVEYGGEYPKRMKLSNMKKATEFAQLAIDSTYEFKFDVESKEYNGRWYTEANCWSWGSTAPQSSSQCPPQDVPQQYQSQAPVSDNLPF